MSTRTLPVTQVDPVVGQRVLFIARFFSDAAGTAPQDPVSVTFRVQYESDVGDDEDYVYGTDAVVTRLSKGVYQFDHALLEDGLVRFRVEGPGTNVGDAVEWMVRARRSGFDGLAGAGS